MADQHKIEINKAGVLDVGERLRASADKGIPPRGDRIKQQLMWHSAFGERSGSPIVQQAATQYYDQMNRAIEFLDTLVYNVGVLAQATQDIVTAYDHADKLSAEDADVVMEGASAKVRDATAAAVAARRAVEMQDRQADLDEIKDLRGVKRGVA
ncbi:hypothetical protein ABT297_19345 [Dactylosporangium sp. NPDC000555]|uniref:hypothetical protein n=1 Tax=Dactylosporangium sp. NPDC000555 TaxID=3154260 RepID=UPI003316579F